MCSSLLRPDPSLPDRYPVLQAMREVAAAAVHLTTLAEWARTEKMCDLRFLKLDTQGSELAILEGAGRLLDDCLGIEVEVEFAPLYIGQPLFTDVDTCSGNGISSSALGGLSHYSERPADQRCSTGSTRTTTL